MTALVIAVGHTASKMENLLRLIRQSQPGMAYELTTVFNGDGFTPDYQIPNKGWDLWMYREGLQHSVRPDWAFFLNDDVVHIHGDWLAYTNALMQRGFDCVGAQPNLASWADWDAVSAEARARFELQGRAVRFVRTSAFAMTRDYFRRCYAAARGVASVFEKGTIRPGSTVGFLPEVDWIYDSNTAPFILHQRLDSAAEAC